MQDNKDLLFDESIRLELNAAKLYRLFGKLFPEDFKFWNKLEHEEEHHAAMIRSGKETLSDLDLFPVEAIETNLEKLVESNGWIEASIAEFTTRKPEKCLAYSIALQLESSAGEINFQEAFESSATCLSCSIFKKLVGCDIDHAKRIRSLMAEQGLPCIQENKN